MTDEEWVRAPRVPQVSVIRRALKLYLRVIAREPKTVRKALAVRTKPRL
jgi:hypothetical protein